MTKLRRSITFETTFGSYIAQDILGEGGAGRVYAATAPDNTPVAIKVLTQTSTDKRRRFKNEINFLLRTTHANIVKVLDHGVITDGPFYVMPRYNASLRNLMRAGLTPAQVLPWYSQILDGVEAAHLHGVIHRDLKPENILWHQSTNTLAIADFGVAHFTEELLATIIETGPTQRLANFQYAAPEQRTSGRHVGQTADVYALGLLLNELYTGTIPHGTGYQTIASMSSEHAFLDPIVEALLSQAPAGRPASIEEVKTRIQRYQADAVSRQRLSTLENTVVPTDQIDEPLALIPPRLINADWNRGTLILTLDRDVTPQWLQSFNNMTVGGYISGASPGEFHFQGAKATVSTAASQAQLVINHFKTWLPTATANLKARLTEEARRREEQRREQLRREREAEEQRLKVISNLTV